MRDPHRLLDISENEVERLLLRAGRASAPPGAQKRAVVAATAVLGASVMVGNAAVGGAGVSAKSASLAAFGSIKWLALVGAIGVATVASAVVIRHSTSLSTIRAPVPASPAPTHRAASPKLAAPPPPTQALTAAVDAPLASVPPSASAPPPRATVDAPRAVSTAPSFSDELATLDRVRGAMNSGEPARALSILEGYRARFPNGAMRPEAAILRIEALEKAGDHAAAVRAADALLESDPATPYAARVRSVVGTSNP